MQNIESIKTLLGQVLPSCDTSGWSKETALLGALPEFDSMTIMNLITLVEESYDVFVDEADVSADDFITVGAIADWIERVGDE